MKNSITLVVGIALVILIGFFFFQTEKTPTEKGNTETGFVLKQIKDGVLVFAD